MGLKPTNVDSQTLKDAAAEDGVGALGLSQSDSQLRTYQAKVLKAVEVEEGVEIEVDASPLFPGGGGQPPDRGTVDGAAVLEVMGHQHLRVRHAPIGDTVKIEVDWGHRFDMMQQHTAQHLLSALALNERAWVTLSFHLSEESAFVVFDQSKIPQATWSG